MAWYIPVQHILCSVAGGGGGGGGGGLLLMWDGGSERSDTQCRHTHNNTDTNN